MKLKLFFIAVFVVSLAACVNKAKEPYHAETKKLSFNEGWEFRKDDWSELSNLPENRAAWTAVKIPHDWAIEGPFAEEYDPRSGGLPAFGTGWYRKTFLVAEEDQKKIVTIHFDGAMNNAEIWVNKKLAGERPYGYSSFSINVSPYLNYGKEPNVILVKLSPEELSSRWYAGAGLYRNVWIEKDHPIHLTHWGTSITTPEVSSAQSEIHVVSQLANAEDNTGNVVLRLSVLSENGTTVASDIRQMTIDSHDTIEVNSKLTVNTPLLWAPDTPYLYTLKTEIIQEGQIIDEENTDFGIRQVSITKDRGVEINGKAIELKGVCLHHDLGPLGVAVNRRAIERQLEIMKAMGANAIRTSHNPPSPEQLELCDQLGLLVIDEAFDEWQKGKVPNGYNKSFDVWHERDLRDMIRRDKNHPSIIMWSIGNEIFEQTDAENGWKLTRRLAQICKDEDPTRPTTAAFNYYPHAVVNKLAAEVDIVGLNYYPTKYEEILSQHPDWIVVGSETSACVSSRGVYHLPMEVYEKHPSKQITSYDIIGPPWAYPPDVEFHFQEKNPRILGEFIWTGFDYLGEPTPYGGLDNHTNGRWKGDWPARSSYLGAVDLCGIPKDRYYLYQSQWTQKPMIHLLPHWNWEGREEEVIPVYAYTNCEKAELFVNGVSQGIRVKGKDTTPLPVDLYYWPKGKKFHSKYRLRWDVPYSPGTIKVVGYNQDTATVVTEIKTAGEPSQLAFFPDRQKLKSDGEDLSFITVKVLDKDGNVCPRADNLLTFHVEGQGELFAVGNGNAASTLSFKSKHRPAFNGSCMVIIRSGKGKKGKITLKAKGVGIDEQLIVLDVE